ncbi:MAG: hypothetical protein K0R54_741 [Clostridiaceae bacterium]|jgi:hypothetical protein|nr:hypothetical protein [Clostridiaceae bacterium]
MGMDRLYGGLIIVENQHGNVVKCTKRIFGFCKDAKNEAIMDLKESMKRHGVDFSDSWIFTARRYNATFSDVSDDEIYFFCKAEPQ